MRILLLPHQQKPFCRATRCLPLLSALGLVAGLLACGSGGPEKFFGGGRGTGGSGASTGQLYVTDNGVPGQTSAVKSILHFSGALSTTVTLAGAISGTNTGLTNPRFLALDVTGNRLYVADASANAILEFDNISTASGNIAPTRTISGTNTALNRPVGLALDPGRDLLYVSNSGGNSILVFHPASTVTGNTAPARVITTSPSLAGEEGLFLDTTNDRLFVADTLNSAVDVMDAASTLSGTVSGQRVISGANTQLASPVSVLLDAAGNLFVANAASSSIVVFNSGATATGNVTPSATISGSSTQLSSPGQMALDPASGDLFVSSTGATAAVLVFANPARGGNVAPAMSITNASMSSPSGLALDTTR